MAERTRSGSSSATRRTSTSTRSSGAGDSPRRRTARATPSASQRRRDRFAPIVEKGRAIVLHRRFAWVPAAVVIAAALALMVLPVRNYFVQNEEIAQTRREIAAIKDQNAELRRKASVQNDPAALELKAREDLGMVLPGEESYVVLAPSAAGQVPDWVSVGLNFDPKAATSGTG